MTGVDAAWLFTIACGGGIGALATIAVAVLFRADVPEILDQLADIGRRWIDGDELPTPQLGPLPARPDLYVVPRPAEPPLFDQDALG